MHAHRTGRERLSSYTVAVVSDTHGHLDPRVEAAVKGCDYAVHAGDVGSATVLRALRACVGEVIAVAGNNDVAGKWPASDLEVLQSLPAQAQLQLPGGVLMVVHGDRVLPAARRHSKLRSMFPEARAIVYGHSHRLCEDQDAVPWVLNPGAAGRARTYGGPSCMLLEAGGRGWRVQTMRFEVTA